jgi:hypothetical protein
MSTLADSCWDPRLFKMHSRSTAPTSVGVEVVALLVAVVPGVGQGSRVSGGSMRTLMASPSDVADDGVGGLVTARKQVRCELSGFANVGSE